MNLQKPGSVGLIFTNPSIQISNFPHASWWLANGSIPAANVLEHVDSPTGGQNYAGGAISDGSAWTVAARTNTFTVSATSRYIFDSQTGRFILGISDATHYGIYTGTWNNAALFPDTNNHVIMAVCDGTNIQAYLDGVSTGTTITKKGIAVSGATKWRSSFDSLASWANAVQHGAVFNIALTAAQIAALYNSMRLW